MSYESLMRLQDGAQIFHAACLLGGLLFLLIGLFHPHWVGFSRRLWVILIAVGIWMLGLIVWIGAIAYTHSRPNGPHAFQSYMDGMLAEACIADPAKDGCAELKQKCAAGDATHPACRILAGEDPAKFYTRTTQ